MPMMLTVGVPVFAALVLLVWVAGIAITAGNIVLVANAAAGVNVAAVNDAAFDWGEAERLANLRDFQVLSQLRALREELSHA